MGLGGQHHPPASLLAGKRPVTHCTGGWLGPRAGLNVCKKSRPHTGIRSSDRPARSQSLYISFRNVFQIITTDYETLFLTALYFLETEDKQFTVFVGVKIDQLPECALKVPMANKFCTYIRGWIQNFPDWCRHLHSSCVSAKHR